MPKILPQETDLRSTSSAFYKLENIDAWIILLEGLFLDGEGTCCGHHCRLVVVDLSLPLSLSFPGIVTAAAHLHLCSNVLQEAVCGGH